jgi:hypothetical protein
MASTKQKNARASSEYFVFERSSSVNEIYEIPAFKTFVKKWDQPLENSLKTSGLFSSIKAVLISLKEFFHFARDNNRNISRKKPSPEV